MRKLYKIHPPYTAFKTWLIENNIKLETVATILGIKATEVSLKNNGFSDYSITDLNKLAEHLGVNLNIFKPQKISLCSTTCSTKLLKPQKQVSGHSNKVGKVKLINGKSEAFEVYGL